MRIAHEPSTLRRRAAAARTALAIALLSTITPLAVWAQEHGVPAEGAGTPNLLSPEGGLMLWTLIIFVILMFVLSKFAFKPITAAVVAREEALEKAIADAHRDREEAARVLEKNREQIEGARAEAQRLIAEGRAVGEKMRTEMLEEARAQQQELLERARHEIEMEKERAIATMRREAVELAIAGASKVIEKNLDADANRRIVESFLADVAKSPAAKTR